MPLTVLFIMMFYYDVCAGISNSGASSRDRETGDLPSIATHQEESVASEHL